MSWQRFLGAALQVPHVGYGVRGPPVATARGPALLLRSGACSPKAAEHIFPWGLSNMQTVTQEVWGRNLRICVPNKLPGKPSDAGPGNTL